MADDLVVREWDTAMMPFLEVKVAIAEHNALRSAYLALLKSWNEDESDSHHALEEWEKLDAQLAAMTAERDDLQGQAIALERELAASEAARGRLERLYAEDVARMEELESRGDLTPDYGRESLRRSRKFLSEIRALAEPKEGES